MQWREALLRTRLKFRTMLNEQSDDVRMMLRDGPHERRLVLRRLLRVDVGSTGNQHPNSVGTAGAGARHDRRLAGTNRRIWIGPGFEQPLYQRRVSVGARQRQRSDAKIVRDVCIRAGANQQVSGFDIIPMCSPEQRRGAIMRSHIHVHALTEQRTNLLHVPVPGGLYQPEIALAAAAVAIINVMSNGTTNESAFTCLSDIAMIVAARFLLVTPTAL